MEKGLNVVDDFLKEPIDGLHDLDYLWRVRLDRAEKKSYYWHDCQSVPETPLQKLCLLVWGSWLGDKLLDYEGIEYWVVYYKQEGSVCVHIDDCVYLNDKDYRPVYGSVYYPVPITCTGGEYIYMENGLDSDHVDMVVPRENRLLYSEQGTVYHAVTDWEGDRVSIAMNLWRKKPPCEYPIE